MITVHVHGLRVFGHHGVHAEERQKGQDFLFDIDLEVGDRGAGDDFTEAVDYVEVARIAKDVSEARHYNLVESLATAVADELESRFGPEHLLVRVRKPEIRPAGLDGTVGVTVTRP